MYLDSAFGSPSPVGVGFRQDVAEGVEAALVPEASMAEWFVEQRTNAVAFYVTSGSTKYYLSFTQAYMSAQVVLTS
jgi:hypothetical protein